jgi:hypothetical protein
MPSIHSDIIVYFCELSCICDDGHLSLPSGTEAKGLSWKLFVLVALGSIRRETHVYSAHPGTAMAEPGIIVEVTIWMINPSFSHHTSLQFVLDRDFFTLLYHSPISSMLGLNMCDRIIWSELTFKESHDDLADTAANDSMS